MVTNLRLQEMGLGKTLTTLALIAGSVFRDNDNIPIQGQPTLIVCPLSSIVTFFNLHAAEY
jgi:SNF2 family DNA or RNA helicase